jgi:uncharacterized protein (TIGR01777 family)
MDTRILMTGATGLVGTALTAQLRAAGVSVNYLTTRSSAIENMSDYKGFLWNPAKGELDPKCFDGVRAIVNLAGSPVSQSWSKKGRELILNSRIDSLNCLFNGLKQTENHQIEHIVSASAIGIYPSSLTHFYREEDTITQNSGFLPEVVRLWEAGLNQFQEWNISRAILRIGLVLDPNGGVLPVMARPIRLGFGASLGSGKQWQSWIHIQDLVSIFSFALEERVEGVFNAVAPNPVSNSRFTKELARVLNRPLLLPPVPAFMLRLIMGERSALALDSQRVCSSKIQEEGFVFEYPNLSPALEDLYGVKKK